MTARECLGSIRKYYIIIKQKKEEQEELKASLSGLQSLTLSDIRSEQKTYNAPFTERVHRLLELEEETERLCEDFAVKRNHIIKLIHSLSDARYIEILYKRYVEYKSFEDIAAEMHYSYSHIRRMHKKAIAAFEEIFVKKLKDDTK